MKKTAGDIIILQSYDVRFLRYGVRQTEFFLSFWAIFSHFTPLTTPKIKIFKKKMPLRYYEVGNVYHKWQSYDVWLLRYGAQQREFLVILYHFLPFYPRNNPKNQNFEEMKKIHSGDIIILHMCTIQSGRQRSKNG